MERRTDPSTLEYVMRVKKVEVASCETISHVLDFEDEMNAWIEELERKEEERNE